MKNPTPSVFENCAPFLVQSGLLGRLKAGIRELEMRTTWTVQ
jgi:hypothetical protein